MARAVTQGGEPLGHGDEVGDDLGGSHGGEERWGRAGQIEWRQW